MQRMRSALAIVVCIAFTATAYAEDSPEDVKLRRAVLAAIGKRDAAEFGAQLQAKPLRLYHVWFDTAACTKEFGGKVAITAAKVPRLVTCLARLGLTEGKNGTFVHAPGVTLVPLLYRGKLAGLSGVAVETSVPTVSDAALTSNLVAGTLDVPPGGETEAATVWLEACVNPSGKIEKVSTKRSTSPTYAKTIEAAAARWSFKPFKRDGKPIRVCLQRAYETLPAP